MKEKNYHLLGHTLLRVTIGLLFVISGIRKFSNPEGVSGMLGGIGFPAPIAFAWILIASEFIFGLLIFIGYKVKYTAWPLAFVLFVALITVTIPNSGIGSTNAFFHMISIAGLITIALTGPGKFGLSKD
jgi:uncharacterized membrane protein YphA (DoxX/SURF4 family)